MGEHWLDVLDKYDVEVQKTAKVRGAVMFETDKGKFLLKEFKGTEAKISFEAKILEELAQKICVETYVKNKNDCFITESDEGLNYIVKTWHEGRECNVRDTKEVSLAVRMLGWLHLELNELQDRGALEWKAEDIAEKITEETESSDNVMSVITQKKESLGDLFGRHNRELKRVRTYIKGRKAKNSFERLVMDSYCLFSEQAERALSIARTHEPKIDYRWCHGEFSHHHVVFGQQTNVITEFSHMHIGAQMNDLYYFARKVLEKNRWDIKLGREMFNSYNSVRRILPDEWDYLYLLFLYPEKYWKQVNYYYNSNKAWMPEKNVDKLKAVINQQELREQFLEELKKRTSYNV